MEFSLPDEHTVFKLHEIALEVSGGLKGVLHPERVGTAIHRPKNYMHYNKECSLHLVCAILLDSIARGHAFTEGNKRTALLTTLMTYRLNGLRFTYSWIMQEKYTDIALWVVNERPAVEEIEKKLEILAEEFKQNFLERLRSSIIP